MGLPYAAVRELRERVRAALLNSGFDFPLKRYHPATWRPRTSARPGPASTSRSRAAVLVASDQVANGVLERYALAGELALDGSIRPVPGALAMAEGARALGLRGIAVAPPDAPPAPWAGRRPSR